MKKLFKASHVCNLILHLLNQYSIFYISRQSKHIAEDAKNSLNTDKGIHGETTTTDGRILQKPHCCNVDKSP